MRYLSIGLSEYYKENQTWKGYSLNKNLWATTVNSMFFKVFLTLSEPPTHDQLKTLTKANSNIIPQPPKGKPICDPPFGSFLQRLSLLDSQKQEVVSSEIIKDDFNFQEIKLDGEIVGWLKVGKLNVDSLPLGEQIFQQQLKLTLWVAALGAITATILSYFLSRHITAPIKQLTSHASEIAKRNLQTNIKINTKDEIRDLAQSINTISKELKLYDTRQKQWLMDISHEIRTPLSILTGEIFAICDNITEYNSSSMSSLKEEVEQIRRLIDDLDDIATLEKSNFKLDKQKINLQLLIDFQVQRYQEKLLKKGIKLHLDIPDCPILIKGDSYRMGQVFINLFENCIRHMEVPGDLWLASHQKGNKLIITVQDSGPGVPQESLSRLFDRLYRTDTSRDRATGGTGLGLAICKQIVLAHNGTIEAVNGSKGGLSIQINLPLPLE